MEMKKAKIVMDIPADLELMLLNLQETIGTEAGDDEKLFEEAVERIYPYVGEVIHRADISQLKAIGMLCQFAANSEDLHEKLKELIPRLSE